MIRFKYKDINEKFYTWDQAARWLYTEWEERNSDIVHLVDSDPAYFLEFSGWVNERYDAYVVLSCNFTYEDLFDRYIEELGGDIEDYVYKFSECFIVEE